MILAGDFKGWKKGEYCIVALFLMSKRYTENWYLWILVNAISVILWLRVGDISSETVATLLMYGTIDILSLP
ncbi:MULTISPECIES: nicotinamide mononucleotide transporter [Psychrilyobacter]|uniref:Nicotinamide riboside transporter PnuC n=1 Tax=Psychrilyobacter piezotolerans TaxID=2293438 RepID=A0ABX9KIV7_9FUSO|nr:MULTISPECIES: nicotinamide mononucleotide transporter [Psychrilyobacter]MCS5421113.1 nicotinamide mononucleotide transporter family protein [Psychrilyobacter sp. S5]NDI77115.1 nicotinamide mononucleotide transporter [Psychrilyobacter piezotolerans]RDE64114.1 hypothetical protein DV867_04060 [Psychrilyobacter sp. S5]REI42206.1 hypothetical protein DYH56_04060 [Psychrilyobacter piezotolerans]